MCTNLLELWLWTSVWSACGTGSPLAKRVTIHPTSQAAVLWGWTTVWIHTRFRGSASIRKWHSASGWTQSSERQGYAANNQPLLCASQVLSSSDKSRAQIRHKGSLWLFVLYTRLLFVYENCTAYVAHSIYNYILYRGYIKVTGIQTFCTYPVKCVLTWNRPVFTILRENKGNCFNLLSYSLWINEHVENQFRWAWESVWEGSGNMADRAAGECGSHSHPLAHLGAHTGPTSTRAGLLRLSQAQSTCPCDIPHVSSAPRVLCPESAQPPVLDPRPHPEFSGSWPPP